MAAIAHADTIIHWHENNHADEIPPQWMWPFDDELRVHWEQVREAREDGRTPSNSRVPKPDLVSNELTRNFDRK